MKAGKHILINIPRGERGEDALLRVQAIAQRLGVSCADMYFVAVDVTGVWPEAQQVGGYHHNVSQSDVQTPEWISFGKAQIKVVHGTTKGGIRYLNVYVKHLGRTGFAVGGLLGEDDHSRVVVPPASCLRNVHLTADSQQSPVYSLGPSTASFASASLE